MASTTTPHRTTSIVGNTVQGKLTRPALTLREASSPGSGGGHRGQQHRGGQRRQPDHGPEVEHPRRCAVGDGDEPRLRPRRPHRRETARPWSSSGARRGGRRVRVQNRRSRSGDPRPPGRPAVGRSRGAGRSAAHRDRRRLSPGARVACDRQRERRRVEQPAADLDGNSRVDDPATTNTGRRVPHLRRQRRLRVHPAREQRAGGGG